MSKNAPLNLNTPNRKTLTTTLSTPIAPTP